MDRMDEDPSEICSYNVNRVIHEGIGDLNKKRKMLDELLGLPPPKWRFRDRGSGSVRSFHCVEHSEMDSNSLVGESNSVSSPSTESTFQTELPKSSLSSLIQSSSSASQASTSSGHESNSSLKDSVSSSDSTSMEEESRDKEEEEESPFLKGQELLGNYADYPFSEHGSDEIEEFLDMKSEELMLYSNAATSDLYVLSSGRWNIDKDADGRRGVKKPTIDQEFEQYFSTLML